MTEVNDSFKGYDMKMNESKTPVAAVELEHNNNRKPKIEMFHLRTGSLLRVNICRRPSIMRKNSTVIGGKTEGKSNGRREHCSYGRIEPQTA